METRSLSISTCEPDDASGPIGPLAALLWVFANTRNTVDEIATSCGRERIVDGEAQAST